MTIRFDDRYKQVEKLLSGHRAQQKYDALRKDSDGISISKSTFEDLDAQIIETLYDELKALEFVPVSQKNPDADLVSFQRSDEFEDASQEDHHRLSDSFKDVAVSRTKETPRAVLEGHAAYSYHVDELGSADGFNVVAERAKLAAKSIARWHDRMVKSGSQDGSISGLPSVGTPVSVVNGSWVAGTTSGEAIYEDIVKLVNQVQLGTRGNFEADTLVLGLDAYQIMQTTLMSTDNNSTALDFVRRNLPQLKQIEPWVHLNTAGTSSKSRALAYKKDPSVVQYAAVRIYDEAPPFEAGFKTKVHCRGRSAGVFALQPKAICYMDLT